MVFNGRLPLEFAPKAVVLVAPEDMLPRACDAGGESVVGSEVTCFCGVSTSGEDSDEDSILLSPS